ncbi:MAG: hypothetical protein KDC34_10085 [Saprospiraceae bacterium]|nr:hypothetical protein [Saprospiraceae bacterium]
MKKLFFSLISMLLIASVSFAQDASKDLKKATRALGSYHLDPTNNLSKLEEAKELIDGAIGSELISGTAGAWIARGEIYNALVAKEVNQLLTGLVIEDSNYKLPEDITKTANVAVTSFTKALGLAEKKPETNDALKGLSESASYLNSIGNDYLQKSNYQMAYEPLNAVLDINKTVTAAGADPVLTTADDVSNTKYVVAYCASLAGKEAESKRIFKELIDEDYQEAGVYAAYINLLMKEEGSNAQVEAVLEKGKKVFPGNTELLFAEINYYLRQNRLEELVDKLQIAIDKEPENPTLYSTLGNVYDQLFQKELEAGHPEQANANFEAALGYYNQAVAKDSEYAEAIYSIGALYFNKAAAVSKEMISMEDDYSREGIKKYEGLKAEMMNLFDQALPFFEKAEKMDPNDINTLIALREIFARKDDVQTSNEFKARMEKVQNGETISESYFK